MEKAIQRYRTVNWLLKKWLIISLVVVGIGGVVIGGGWLLAGRQDQAVLLTIITAAFVALIVFATPQFMKTYAAILKARHRIDDDA